MPGSLLLLINLHITLRMSRPTAYVMPRTPWQSAEYCCVSTPAERPGKGGEGWWAGLGTIPALSRDEITPL